LTIPKGLDIGLAKLYRPEGVYRASAGISYNPGRDEDDNTALNGMGDIKGHAVASVGIDFEANESGWRYGVAYAGDLSSDDNGSVLSGQVGYAFPLSETMILTPALHADWANDDHMQTYFGVSQTQANASSNNKFDAGSGVKSVGLGAELDWSISESWKFNGGLNYTRLTNDAADSPLVKNQGSPDQFETSIALIYAF
ncbi:MAG: MipA/OmpV family protein, partial [Planctomycetes bacterium]|nr:MipA/OmpV family protein [Planctomycetota bacterium]